MRPSLDIDPGLLVPPSQRSGTGRHTLPDAPAALRERLSLDGVADEFFSEGDAGTYEGGPALLAAEVADEPELASVKAVVRTPEMDLRRARGMRVVAGVVGCLAAVLAFGVVRASASERKAASPPGLVTAHATQPAGASPEVLAAPAEHAVALAAPEEVAAPKAIAALPESPRRTAVATESSHVAPPPRAPALAPAQPVVVAPRPASALPAVANFAARSGDAPKSTGKVPTASFAPQ